MALAVGAWTDCGDAAGACATVAAGFIEPEGGTKAGSIETDTT